MPHSRLPAFPEEPQDDQPPAGVTPDHLRSAQRRVHDVAIHALTDQVAELAVWQRQTKTAMGSADTRLKGLEAEVSSLKTEVGELKALIGELRDLIAAVKGGFKVLSWLGQGAKWLGILASAGAAIYTAGYMLTHGGNPPGKG